MGILTPAFRVAYPSVFRPKRNELSGKDEYSVVALFSKGEDLSKLIAAAEAALFKTFGADKKKWPTNRRSPFRDQGDRVKTNDDGKEVLPQGYEHNAIYINLKSKQRPGIVDQSVQDIIDEADFYAGCWARAEVNAYAYDMAGNRGVSFGLGNIQKLKDDDHFGNRTKPQDCFSPVSVDTAKESNSKTSAADLFS